MPMPNKTLYVLGLTEDEFLQGYDAYDREWMSKNLKHPPTAEQLAHTLRRVLKNEYQGRDYDADCINYAIGAEE